MEIIKKTQAGWPGSFTWLPVIVFMATAMAIRFWTNTSGNYLLIGGDGPYYPLQTRSMYENFKLALPDMPLLFIIEAFVAKLLHIFHYSSLNNCMIMAVKLTDAVLPPLAAIPVFFLANELKPQGIKSWLLNYLMVCFSIINLTTSTIFSSGLQKNAFAVVWIFSFMHFFTRLLKNGQRRDLYYSFIILFLCAITHFGSFTILLLFILVISIVWLCCNFNRLKQIRSKWVLITLFVLTLAVIVLGFFDPFRLWRLVDIPLKIVEYPVLLMILNGEDIGAYMNPLHMIVANILAMMALIIIINNRKKMSKEDRLISYGLIVFTLVLSSPLIGIEWANRLYVLSYIPVTVLYLFILHKTGKGTLKIAAAAIVNLLIILSVVSTHANHNAITDEAYEEFTKLNDKVNFEGRTVVIGRQDLRLLASWEFRTKSASDYLFTKEDFMHYDHVLVIRQIKGSNFSAGRPRGDARVPANAIKIYEGTCFELYKIKNNDGWEGGKGKPAGARGKIISSDKQTMTIKNGSTGNIRVIELNEDAVIHFENGRREFPIGACVEVYAHKKALSLHLVAESIREIDCDQ